MKKNTKVSFNEFEKLSTINKLGEFMGETKYAISLPIVDKIAIVMSCVESSYNKKTKNFDEIALQTTLKYLIITSYIKNVNFPTTKINGVEEANIEVVVDTFNSTGMYESLISLIASDYADIVAMLNGKKEEMLRENSVATMLSAFLSNITELDADKIKGMANELEGLKNLDVVKQFADYKGN